MKVNEIEVRIGVTINIGNFESARLDYSARAQVEHDESAKSAIDSLRENLKDKMARDVAEGKHKLTKP